ncbi:hypothetical protein AB0M45_30985 [Nocardia sp. NPDC051787]|uniref:hypothetical protein n=1 Tax=Nocardia sp. NPDC051787 TaxID=3155415 RepID=UPI003428BC20
MLALLTSGARTSWIGLYPDSGHDLDRPQATSAMRLLLPHLRQALTVQSRLADARSERDRATAVLDLQGHGLVIVASCGAVSYANPAALSIPASGDGLGIGRRGHLESSDSRAAAELRAMIDSAVQKHGQYAGGARSFRGTAAAARTHCGCCRWTPPSVAGASVRRRPWSSSSIRIEKHREGRRRRGNCTG